VIKVGGFQASGFIGWLAWLGIHIAFLTSFRKPAGCRPHLGSRLQPRAPAGRAFSMQEIVAGRDLYPGPNETDW